MCQGGLDHPRELPAEISFSSVMVRRSSPELDDQLQVGSQGTALRRVTSL